MNFKLFYLKRLPPCKGRVTAGVLKQKSSSNSFPGKKTLNQFFNDLIYLQTY